MNKDTIKIKQALEAAASELSKLDETLPLAIACHEALAALSAEQQEEAKCEHCGGDDVSLVNVTAGDGCEDQVTWCEDCNFTSGSAAPSNAQPQEQPQEMCPHCDDPLPAGREQCEACEAFTAAPVTVQPAKPEAWMSSKNRFLISNTQKQMAIKRGEPWHESYDVPLVRCATSKEASAPAREQEPPPEWLQITYEVINQAILMGKPFGGYEKWAQGQATGDAAKFPDPIEALARLAYQYVNSSTQLAPTRDEAWNGALDEAAHLCESNATLKAGEVAKLIRALQSHPAQAGKEVGQDAGIEAAAKWVDQRRFDFEKEHGVVDWSTGAIEFGTGSNAQLKEEYVTELAEIAEGIRTLKGGAA